MSLFETLDKYTEAMRGKINLMLGHAVLNRINDTTPVQTAQVAILADETQDDVERIQEYGFTSVPPAGSEAVVVFQGGNRDHGLIIATDNRTFRLKNLASGEVALYTDEGDTIVFRRGNVIEITAAATVTITAPLVTIAASEKVRLETPTLEVTGEIIDLTDAGGKTMSGMRGIYNTHTHPENDSGGPTSPPNQGM
ncbi:MAG: phage baseplate assembly protein V [Candidatus Accumulibacter sp.]|jgi:phage baseplate assembly protein V|nr:phage baseplate assembly protein V [Accumulibacter sp.]